MKAFAKFGVILLIGLLCFPSSIEFAHIFVGHQHEVCSNHSDTHFHGKNVDCELFSFQKVSFSFPEFSTFNLVNPEIRVPLKVSEYLFLNTVSLHTFEQRGPPEVSA